jgi:site-specific recombinase XerD
MAKGRYGVCPTCLQYKYLNRATCKTCTYSYGTCLSCEQERKIYVDGLCYLCYQDRQVLTKIKKLELEFIPANEYNGQLFALFLTYIKRYRLTYAHVKQTKQLVEILKKEEISTIKSWHDIYCLSDNYIVFTRPNKLQGCAFVKMGYMLSELGIIPPREDELDQKIYLALSYFSTKEVEEFSNSLLKINTAKSTVLHYLHSLRKLESFTISEFEVYSLLLLDQFHLTNFFDMIQEEESSLQSKRKIFFNIQRFYKWVLLNKYILLNPCPDIKFSRPNGRIVICSEEQFLDLKRFIRNENSDPEGAILLALILFYGLTTIELTYAQVIIQDDKLSIKLRRRELTKGKKYYNRKELLQLPVSPTWFAFLQKRFMKKWSKHYQQVKKSYPLTPLVLPKSNISNRYLSTESIRNKVYDATIEATGQAIPIRVLRQTCGHLYSSKADASILSSMGWSNQFAFHYTWLPRIYYSKK